MQTTCNHCQGEGYQIKKGYQMKKINQEIEINIQKGLKEDDNIIIENEGNINPKNPQEKGDIVFIIKELQHSHFVRKNQDLIFTKKISIFEALAGFTFYIENLENENLEININEIVNKDTVKVIQNQGMPYKNKNKYGNIIVFFDIEYPNSITIIKKNIIKIFLKFFKK